MYTVYMHISPNGKRYVGITSKSKLEHRWGYNGKGYKKQKRFYNAIEKYGWDNFEHIIIVKGLSKKEAEWLEIELIRELDLNNQDKGYNITKGGEGTKGVNPRDYMTEDTKKEQSRKLSEANSGKNNPMYGKNAYEGKSEEEMEQIKNKRLNTLNNKSEEEKEKTRDKMSKSHSGENNSMYGVHRYGKDNPNAKAVICLNNNEVYDTMKEADEKYKCCVEACINGRNKSAGNDENEIPLVWMLLIDYEINKPTVEEINNKIQDAIKSRNRSGENNYNYGKSMAQEQKNKISKTRIEKGIGKGKNNPNAKAVICITTGRIFYTAKEGAKYYSCNKSALSECCNGNRKSCGKYQGKKLVWRKLDDFLKQCEYTIL